MSVTDQSLWEANFRGLFGFADEPLHRWNDEFPLGSPVTVTFRFADEYPSYSTLLQDPSSFRSIPEELRAIAKDVLLSVSSFTNIRFVEDRFSSYDQVDIVIMGNVFSGGAAFFPGSRTSNSGDIVIGIGPATGFNGSGSGIDVVGDGSFAGFRQTFIHELGHALGLWHPRDYGNNYPGRVYGVEIQQSLENQLHTVMSYTGANVTGSTDYQWIRTFMPMDMLALQHLYGTNTSTTSGNNTYAFSAFNPGIMTIWDFGGSDIFDLSALTHGANIDLRIGGVSDVGRVHITSDWAQGFDAPAVGNIVIGPNTIIEDVIGSNFNDRILGNAAANHLDGGAGNDVLSGDTGADVLRGGMGNDSFIDSLAGHAGDTITDFSFGDVLVFSDATLGSFNYSLSGSLLTYSGGSLTLTGLSAARLVASASPSGGVQLVLSAPVNTTTIFSSSSGPVIANFNPANGWKDQDQFPRHVADINGDGYGDVVGFGSAGVFVAYGAAGNTFGPAQLMLGQFNAATGWASDNQYHRTVADLNGDGRADIVGFGAAGVYIAIAKANNGFGAITLATNNFGANQGWTNQDGYARVMGDVNGDGKTDIIGFGTAGTWVGLGSGDGTFQSPKFVLANFGVIQGWTADNTYHRELADVNGDGKADIVGFGSAGTYIAFANADGTFGDTRLALANFGTQQGWSSNDGYTRIVTDVNGDHIADIVGFTTGGSLVAIGNGDGTFQPLRIGGSAFGRDQGWTSDNTYHREMADVNHDGLVDIVGFGAAGVYVATNITGFG